MSRRILAGSLLCLTLAILALGLVWLNQVRQSLAMPIEHVREGMTRAEVVRMVGPPTGISDAGLDYWVRGHEQLHVLYDNADSVWLVAIGDDRQPPCHVLMAPPRPTLLEKMRRWLGL